MRRLDDDVAVASRHRARAQRVRRRDALARARELAHAGHDFGVARRHRAEAVAARARRGRARGRRDAGGDSVDDDGAVEDALAARARASARDGDAADIARDVARRDARRGVTRASEARRGVEPGSLTVLYNTQDSDYVRVRMRTRTLREYLAISFCFFHPV